MRNIRCSNERLWPDWSSVVMTTEVSNQQNVLIPNDLQYIHAILSTVSISASGGMIAAAPPRGAPSPTQGLLANRQLIVVECCGMFSTVTQAIAARLRTHSKSKLCETNWNVLECSLP